MHALVMSGHLTERVSDAPLAARSSLEFTAVYTELLPFVSGAARRLGVSSEALDDICQDVFVVVHRHLPALEARSSLKPWVTAILHNLVLVYRRRLRRKSPQHRTQQPLVDVDLLVDPHRDPHEELSNAEANRIARRLLDELDDEKRTVLELVELEEMPVPEVAEATGANLNTTYARLRAARRDLAAAGQRFRANDRWRSCSVEQAAARALALWPRAAPGCHEHAS